MKIVTWNCNMAFRNKKNCILKYNPDVLIIQECENPQTNGNWDEFSDWVWIGDNKNKGLGIFVRNKIKIELINNSNDYTSKYFILVNIIGTRNLTLFGFWAMNDKIDRKRQYIGQVYTALQHYKDFLGAETIIAGDFNWNIIWDRPNNTLYGNFGDTVELLKQNNIFSIYHQYNNSNFGNENDPTFYMYKRVNKPYHIDYIFCSKKLMDLVIDFNVGKYDDWIDVSDHIPIMVQIED